jgi:hypothetical protein
MRILGLAKELGIPYERLLAWCGDMGLPYEKPEDEIDGEHVQRARLHLSGRPSQVKKEDLSMEEEVDNLFHDPDLDLEGLPESLEELEALEENLSNRPREKPKKESGEPRTALESLLKKFGVEGKARLKKIRKLLPEHISRLFNHKDLVEEHAARIEDALENKVVLWCGHAACRDLLKDQYDKKDLIPTDQPAVCRICAGSSTRRGLEEMAKVCREADVRRILIVGGSPASHKELKNHRPGGLEFKLIEGDVSRPRQRAQADMNWCDVAVIWAGTILGHDVSGLYGRGRHGARSPMVVVNRRSVEALCEAVIEHIRRKRDEPESG